MSDLSLRSALTRGIDVVIIILAMVALSVPLAVIFLVLRNRIVAIPTRGRNGRLFGRLNFALEGVGGSVLRETGVDRLPELINVLRGDMSLIGARPDEDVPTEPTRPQSASLLVDLRILVSILLGRQG